MTRPFGAHMSISGGYAKAVARAEQADATALQIFTKNQVQWRTPKDVPGQIEKFSSAYAASPLRFACAHGSYLINLASTSETTRRRSIESLTWELTRADQLGCACLIIHPGSPKQDGRDVGIERIAAGLREVLEATPEVKASIALENTAGQGNSIGAAMEELAAILEQVDWHERVTVCLDSCHAFAAGFDLRTGGGIKKLIDDVESHIGFDRLKVLHLNDSKNGCGTHKDRHDHIGHGAIGETGFRNLLTAAPFRDIPAVIETPKDSDTLEEDRENLQKLRILDMIKGG